MAVHARIGSGTALRADNLHPALRSDKEIPVDRLQVIQAVIDLPQPVCVDHNAVYDALPRDAQNLNRAQQKDALLAYGGAVAEAAVWSRPENDSLFQAVAFTQLFGSF